MDHSVVFLYVHLNFFFLNFECLFFIFIFISFFYSLLFIIFFTSLWYLQVFLWTALWWPRVTDLHPLLILLSHKEMPDVATKYLNIAWRYKVPCWASVSPRRMTLPANELMALNEWTKGTQRMSWWHSTNEQMALNERTNGSERRNKWTNGTEPKDKLHWTNEQMALNERICPWLYSDSLIN